MTRSRPILVAHRGGNSRRAIQQALAVGVDWLETDVWLHYGRLVARHDRSIWRLPLTYGKRSLALHLAAALVLDQVLAATRHTDTRVLIDLKGAATGLPAAIVRTIERTASHERVALCGQAWGPLDTARELNPSVQIVYSLGRTEQIATYVQRRRDGDAPTMTSCYHRLLTADSVRLLKDAGAEIIAWTVDDEARARELLAWGVDGITSNRYGMLGRLPLSPSPSPRTGGGGTFGNI